MPKVGGLILSENCSEGVNRALIVCKCAGACKRMVAEPGRLTLGVLPGHQFDPASCVLQRASRRADGRTVPARRAPASPAVLGQVAAPAVPAPPPAHPPAASRRSGPQWRCAARLAAGRARWRRNRHGVGGVILACQSASPVPLPRQTSQARAMRWLSVGRNRAAVVGSTSARRGVQRGGAYFLQ